MEYLKDVLKLLGYFVFVDSVKEQTMTQSVLLVEDDTALGQQIVAHLEKAGFATTWWEVIKPWDASTLQFGLVILDLMLPNGYGLDALKALRAHSQTPVLILSARNDTHEKVRALKLGADDYMTKPFWPEELVERVRARLRRPILQYETVYMAGGVRLDLQARSANWAGVPIELTRVEFELLLALAKRSGQAISRQGLVEQVLDPDRAGTERTLDVHISRLRKKVGGACVIETVWGIGYRLKNENEA